MGYQTSGWPGLSAAAAVLKAHAHRRWCVLRLTQDIHLTARDQAGQRLEGIVQCKHSGVNKDVERVVCPQGLWKKASWHLLGTCEPRVGTHTPSQHCQQASRPHLNFPADLMSVLFKGDRPNCSNNHFLGGLLRLESIALLDVRSVSWAETFLPGSLLLNP